MRLCLAFVLLVWSGCITVVVPPRDADPDTIASLALGRAQRETEAQQVVLRRESLDAITATAARIATDLQAWALKPTAFGGGGGGLDGATLERLGYGYLYPTDGDRYHTPDGTFWLTQDGDAVLVHGESRVFGYGVIARVAGTSWRDLSLTVQPR